MKNIHMNRAGWAARSSRWSPDNSAGAPSVRHGSTMTNVRELVCASISSSFSSSDPHDQQAGGVSPHRTARVLPFPSVRAPDRGASEGAGGRDTASGVFNGVTVLLVEDDFIVAFDMQTALEEQGARVLGASSLDEARELLANDQPTIAVLDVNLNGDYVFPLVDDLRSREVPFLFATAYSDDERLFPQQVKSAPRLAKPVQPNVLIRQLQRMLR
jgi:two-component system, response regulator PdtaR